MKIKTRLETQIGSNMKMNCALRLASRVLATAVLLIGTGCETTLPVAVSNPSDWNENRAIATINSASNPSQMLYDSVSYRLNYETAQLFKKGMASNAWDDGVTFFTYKSSATDNPSITRYAYFLQRVPYQMIDSVRLEKIELHGLGLIVLGLVNPILASYTVSIKVGEKELYYTENCPKLAIFPLWLIHPLYYVNEDRKIYATNLAEAFEYMRQKHSAEKKGSIITKIQTDKDGKTIP